MAAYIVATVRILDAERFRQYGASLGDLSARHGGEALVRGQVQAFLEGEGVVGERVVVTRFPDAAAARGYVASAEYQAAQAVRAGAADVVMRLVVD